MSRRHGTRAPIETSVRRAVQEDRVSEDIGAAEVVAALAAQGREAGVGRREASQRPRVLATTKPDSLVRAIAWTSDLSRIASRSRKIAPERVVVRSWRRSVEMVCMRRGCHDRAASAKKPARRPLPSRPRSRYREPMRNAIALRSSSSSVSPRSSAGAAAAARPSSRRHLRDLKARRRLRPRPRPDR